MSLIEAQNLHVELGDMIILHDLSFSIQRGTWVGLLGPNGSGKTTLMRTFGGLLPYSGDLQFAGKSLHTWSARALAREMAFVRQTTPLSFDFTVEELVLLGRAPHKSLLQRTDHTDHKHVTQALRTVDLDGFARRSVLSLSGGERQRVFLAQALVQEADLLLLDEPTTHLDVHYQFEFLNVVKAFVGAGRTVIAVFHDLEQAARYADHLLVLHQGRLAASGPPRDILTEALIAKVFRMRAHLDTSETGKLRIDYLAPTAGHQEN